MQITRAVPDRSYDPKLAVIVRRLVIAYMPKRIYLFGSVARGAAGPDSDYDLMVIVPDDASPERRCSRLAYQVLRGTAIAADVLVWPRQVFDERVHAGPVCSIFGLPVDRPPDYNTQVITD